ncbi:hypothetical protein YC2023_022395 [Brassica napus]
MAAVYATDLSFKAVTHFLCSIISNSLLLDTPTVLKVCETVFFVLPEPREGFNADGLPGSAGGLFAQSSSLGWWRSDFNITIIFIISNLIKPFFFSVLLFCSISDTHSSPSVCCYQNASKNSSLELASMNNKRWTKKSKSWLNIREDEKQRRETPIVGVTEETKQEKSTGPPNYPASRVGPTRFVPIPSRSCPRGPPTNGP